MLPMLVMNDALVPEPSDCDYTVGDRDPVTSIIRTSTVHTEAPLGPVIPGRAAFLNI